MKRLMTFVVLAALISIALMAVTPLASTQDAPAKTGVIDVDRVFGLYKKVRESEAKLEAEATEEEDAMKRMHDELRKPGLFGPRSERQEKLVALQALEKFRTEEWTRHAQETRNTNTAKSFNEIRAEVALYARENGFTLILRSATGPLDEADKSNARQRINRRSVIYCAPEMDITEEIARRLNAK